MKLSAVKTMHVLFLSELIPVNVNAVITNIYVATKKSHTLMYLLFF